LAGLDLPHQFGGWHVDVFQGAAGRCRQ
jgi:hypothetical protein